MTDVCFHEVHGTHATVRNASRDIRETKVSIIIFSEAQQRTYLGLEMAVVCVLRL
jgi:hypothetical protein